MTYVLDGIKTAYTQTGVVADTSDALVFWDVVQCPCGYVGKFHAALRFHYEHCRQARGLEPHDVPKPQPGIRERVPFAPTEG